MVNIPPSVDDWTLGTITDLLNEGYDEDVQLEFKSEVNDTTEKIPKTACAFANTIGGFIVLGVDNDRTKDLNIMQRICGIDDSDERWLLLSLKVCHGQQTLRDDGTRACDISD